MFMRLKKIEITGNKHLDDKLFQVAYSLSEYVIKGGMIK